MARGWESKSVESQIESREESRRHAARTKVVNPMEAERIRKRESLQMSRTRVLHDLTTANNPRYRKILEQALKHLDDKLAELG
jgi:hypothetical protein